MSGHSKWSQIKHKKAATDAKRGTIFSKMVREITVAARTGLPPAGGKPNPSANIRLKAAMERARSIGLPKDNIDRAIAKAMGHETGLAELSEFLYEAAAPGGIAILIEGITDNKNRTTAQIKHILSQHDARFADQGSVVWNFEKVGIIEVAASPVLFLSSDDMELALIESGAIDIEQQDGAYRITTAFSELDHTQNELEKRGFSLKESGHDYQSRAPLRPASIIPRSLETLLDALRKHDDVQEVYTNLKE